MPAPGAIDADLCEGQLLARPRENGVAHAAVFEPEVSVAAGEVRGALARGAREASPRIGACWDVALGANAAGGARASSRRRSSRVKLEGGAQAKLRTGGTSRAMTQRLWCVLARRGMVVVVAGWHRQFGAAHVVHTADPRRRDVCGFADEHRRRATGVARGDDLWRGVTRLARARALGPGVGRARHFGGCLVCKLGLPNIKYAALSEPSKFTFPAAQLSAEDNVRDVLTHE
ncbi:hypothetical protein DFH09DRAFT_1100708 [Mycena vulgaris]|nr:hypothetical protein DFH09DRAFT_1100708 [Mycena vulgaris]